MSLLPTEEQRELETSLRDFFSREVGAEYLRKRLGSTPERDAALWKSIIDLGLISFFSSQDTESRPGIRELGIIARESGRALLPEPLTEMILAGPWLYSQFLDAAARELTTKHFGSAYPKSLENSAKSVGLAAFSFAKPVTVETRNRGLVRLSAHLPFVACADRVDYMLFCGRAKDSTTDSLFLADLSAGKEQRVTRTPTKALDLTRSFYDVQLDNVAAIDLGSDPAKCLVPVLSALISEELAGICSKVVEMTLEYVKTRKQFGVVIGSFQAVQHRLADMHLQTEALRSLASFATWAAQESKEQAELAGRAALLFACEQAPQIVESAIQMHGGVGFTWEYELHLYLRRAKMLEMLFGGNESAHKALIQAAR